jgi:uncharacterized protein (TIGR02246 family)
MTELTEFLGDAVPRHVISANGMHAGDPEPFLAIWSSDEIKTLFPPEDVVRRGPDEIAKTVRRVAARLSKGSPVEVHILNAGTCGDLAFFTGHERCLVAVDDGPLEPSTMRVTQIYRRTESTWRLLHRHASHGPGDSD